MTSPTQLLVGILVGGGGTRLGGAAKGLLLVPGSLPGAPVGPLSGQTLIERCLGEIATAIPEASPLLVGSAEVYRHLGVPSIADMPSGVGPIGGLQALLEHASRAGASHVLALSCDLPFVTSQLIARLVTEAPAAQALVAVQEGVRNPLFARYAVGPGLAAARAALSLGKRSLQAVLDQLGSGVVELSLTADELLELRDWDTPEDVRDGQVR